MGHKLQCTYRMGHPLKEIALTVREIIHRVYLPLRSGTMMRGLDDAVHDGVAEVHI